MTSTIRNNSRQTPYGSHELLRKTFDAIRDYPDLPACQLAVLVERDEENMRSALTDLYDHNLVARYKRLPDVPQSAGKPRKVYHYSTSVAEFRWEDKPRKNKPREIISIDTKKPAPAPALAPVLAVVRTTPASDRVLTLIAEINELPYKDVVRLKKALSEEFACTTN